MSIVIFGDLFSFPEGGAATNRVITYAKGFKENGVDACIVCFSSEYRAHNEGAHNGINYYYPFGQETRSASFFARNWKKFGKYLRAYRLLRKINRHDKIIAINSWTNLLSTHLYAWIVCKLLGTKLVTEGSEHPLRFHQGGLWKRLNGRVKLYIESRLCDGIFCISRYLVNFYKAHGISQKKLFLVPSTVDPSGFNEPMENPHKGRYIGYFGSLTFKRDNVDMLINAFAHFHNACPGPNLVLGGICTQYWKQQILDLIGKLNIESKVTILDFLSRQEILKYIVNADVLVMTRSRDLESDASYPSKLTEFLATGKPVISVNVGEVSDFLMDGENAFLVEPGDVPALCDKLKFVYENYGQATLVGEKGKQLTEAVFNYNYQAQRMIGFIHSLN